MSSASVLPPQMDKDHAVVVNLNTGEWSDAKIKCRERTWNVHRFIIGAESAFCKRALTFKVGKEAEDGLIDLSVNDPEMIRRMILFMYGGDYDPTGHLECGNIRVFDLACSTPSGTDRSEFDSPGVPSHYRSCACRVPTEIDPSAGIDTTLGPVHHCLSPLATHAEMFALGDRYEVAGLCELAAEKFRSCLREEHFDDEDFVSAIQLVYTTTLDNRKELRDLVAECFRTHFLCDLAKYPQIRENLPNFTNSSMAILNAFRDAKLAAEDSA